MTGYAVCGRSRDELRQYANGIREVLGLAKHPYFPVVEFLEHVLSEIIPEFEYRYLTYEEMGDKHGVTYPDKQIICIREDVYDRAYAGMGRDRFTIAHEIGHLLLHSGEVSMPRYNPGTKIPAYKDSEWQANAFAGELLMPDYIIKQYSIPEIERNCGVSHDAAQFQLSKVILPGDR